MVCAFFLLLLPAVTYTFIVGSCIGPKSALERFLNKTEKAELRRIVHTTFDGSNSKEVLSLANKFVHDHIHREQWMAILPKLKAYQTGHHECSIYAQLLPKQLYKQLLHSVYRAAEVGASKYAVKRLVEDYLDRVIRAGLIPGFNGPKTQTSTTARISTIVTRRPHILPVSRISTIVTRRPHILPVSRPVELLRAKETSPPSVESRGSLGIIPSKHVPLAHGTGSLPRYPHNGQPSNNRASEITAPVFPRFILGRLT